MISFIDLSQFPTWEIIPGFFVRWYSIMYIIAFAVAYFLVTYQVKKMELEMDQESILSFFIWTIIGLLAGARIFGTLVYSPGYYFTHPLEIFLPFKFTPSGCSFTGFMGMSYHGGVVGAVIAAIIFCRRKHLNFFELGDIAVASIPLGYTFGRLGNFLNQELFGRVTTLPWAMYFANAGIPIQDQAKAAYNKPWEYADTWAIELADKLGIDKSSGTINLPRHPSQLYEAFFEGIFLWLIIWFIFRKRKPFQGFLIGIYIIGYGLVRFFLEYVRQPDPQIGFPIRLGAADNPIYRFITPWNLTTGQILCVLMIIGGIIFLITRWQYLKRKQIEPVKEKQDKRKLRKKIK